MYGKELLDDQHSCSGCWVATGLSRRMGCSDLQRSGRGRDSINPVKMKLCQGCHNPFTSSKLYKLFAVFFCIWIMVGLELLESNLHRCSLRVSLFTRSDVWVYWEMTCCSCKTKEHQQQQENQITKYTSNKTRKPNRKYTNKKQHNPYLGKQTQPRYINNGSMHNRAKKSME